MDELIARIVSLIRRYTRFNQQDGAVQQKLFSFGDLSGGVAKYIPVCHFAGSQIARLMQGCGKVPVRLA